MEVCCAYLPDVENDGKGQAVGARIKAIRILTPMLQQGDPATGNLGWQTLGFLYHTVADLLALITIGVQ